MCKTYSFEILIISCVIFIIIYAVYNKYKGEIGTWSSDSYNDYFPYIISKKHFVSPIINDYQSREPTKTDSKGEIECRRVLENIFKRPFNKNRPNFLNNPVTGGKHNLELDCFNQELQIGCEYNGQQHYKYIPHFHKNKESFLNQKYRDDMKRRICKEHNIYLIEVPYTIKINDIQDYLENELLKSGKVVLNK